MREMLTHNILLSFLCLQTITNGLESQKYNFFGLYDAFMECRLNSVKRITVKK